MPLCKNCDTDYGNAAYCLWCEYRREELLERLEPDRKATPLRELAAQGMFIGDRKRWRQSKTKGDPECSSP